MIFPDVAVMVDKPVATPVARPVLDIVTTFVFDELQAIVPVIFCAVLSEYVPIAINCCVAFNAMLGLLGVTAIETSIAGAVIVNITDPDILPDKPLLDVALIVVVPAATAVARPVFEILALLVSVDVQATESVIICVELSE